MQKYISYYRVSSAKQGISGLGLDAQRTDVNRFITKGGELVAEFQDVESGKNDNRPNLIKAIEECKKQGATLLIAKLDRLSRNASFIFTLRDAKIDFVCCDIPNANTVTIGIMAVLAQDERERISQRTKSALAELKAKGVKLGNPENMTAEARAKGLEARKENALQNENNRKATALIISLRQSGKSFAQITRELNGLGFKTRTNKRFQQNQVQILFNRYQIG
ncbi:resolvase [Flavobacterium branchiophilum]|uniref:DNA invertase Pin-like site-specific DNA recombinase n=1 Tax=Flavobacterium branchiophilum TaxID=55197 RepID=A0A543G614_9FLAO|nr:recombinase family protein [Flavobacterium branchiophilum]OXA71674.1 resolvase [Flavobacterium branchiophilum] [Flavobacterium branchiophilum NBRC 15030 = ATCC 35035]TQM41521.1 DNA invertase Pin-like site-specific DNA recombinase [Flavobacterium branchiophilum]GEM55963.1 resolvase [Flavobacterium branchiophilum NBRC 15030 = ATCC 35035]